MGLIEFADKEGIRWRVWHVETPASRAHLMDPNYRNGWLVFEREDGSERRRLNTVPDDWTALTPERLALMCRAAVPVVYGKSPNSGQHPVWSRPEADGR